VANSGESLKSIYVFLGFYVVNVVMNRWSGAMRVIAGAAPDIAFPVPRHANYLGWVGWRLECDAHVLIPWVETDSFWGGS
jgi:hypothetical protein